MTKTIAALVSDPAGDFELTDIVLDSLAPDEALVEIHACGVCHMDVEAKELVPLPCVLGHEGAGIVKELGAKVDNVKVGDRVILGYGFCGQCHPCQDHEPYFCDEGWDLTFSGKRLDGTSTMSTTDGAEVSGAFFQQSSFANLAITPARGLVPIDDGVPWSIAAALPCGFLTGAGTSLNVLNVGSDSSLLVRGVGAVGMGAVVAAKMAGCNSIVASDVRQNRLEQAAKFGATHLHNATESDFDAWREKHFPRGFTHALDTTGVKAVFENTISNLATGGEMAYAILPAPMEEFSFKPFELFVKCASLKSVSFGSSVPAELLPKMLEWWSEGQFPIETVIGEFPFERINDAVAAGHSGDVIKPVLLMNSG